MAIVLNGIDQYAYKATNIVTSSPFTVAGFFKSTKNSGLQVIWGSSNGADTDDYWQLYLDGTPDDVACYVKHTVPPVGEAHTTSSYSTSTWHHAAFVEAGAQDHRVYIDGGSKGQDTTNNVLPLLIQNMSLGALGYNSVPYVNFFEGMLSHFAVWDIALSEAELLLLSNGADPLTIQPDNLLGYWPLMNDANDKVQTNDLTLVGTPTFNTTDDPFPITPPTSNITVAGGLRIDDGTGAASVWAYDESGEIVWSYDTGHSVNSVFVDESENVYIAGRAADNGSGMKNFWKLNSLGQLLGGRYVLSNAYAWDIALDSLGRIIVGTGSGAARISADLSTESTITPSGTINSVAVDLVDNGIYIGSGGFAANLRRYSSALAYEWTRTLHATAIVKGIEVLSDRRVVFNFAYAAGVKVVYCYTHLNVQSWYYDTVTTTVNKLAVDSNDNIYGVSSANGDGNRTFFKLNSSGVEQWFISHDEFLRDVFVGKDDVAYCSGERIGSICVWKVVNQALVDCLFSPGWRIEAIGGSSLAEATSEKVRVDKYNQYNGGYDFQGTSWLAQTFYASETFSAIAVRLPLYRQGSPGEQTLDLHAVDGERKPTGSPLATVSFPGGGFTTDTNGEYREFILTHDLTQGVEYAIVMSNPTGNLFNRLLVKSEVSSPSYNNGQAWKSTDSGSTWTYQTTREFNFEVLKALIVVPVITNESVSQIILAGQKLSLFVTATGDPAPTYQWYRNNSPLSGETNSTLTIYPVVTGTYKCVVTNVGGTDTSNDMVITVKPNPYRYNPYNVPLDSERIT